MVHDILQLNFRKNRKLFCRIPRIIVLHPIGNVLVVDFLLQILTHIIEEGLEVGNVRHVRIHAVCGRKESCRCNRKCAQLRNQCRQISRASHHLNQQIQDNARHKDPLNQKSWCGAVQAVLLHGIDVAVSAFGVLRDEIILAVRNLDFLHRIHRLCDPLIQTGIIILILLAGLDHHRL